MDNYEQMSTGDSKPQTPRIRDKRIDSVKYWLIILVIAGHVFMRPEFKDSTACGIILKWIYMFHMPLFVFLSGYFSRKKSRETFASSIWRIAEPLLIIQTIIIISRLVSKVSISLYDFLTPWWVLWYLLSLIYWRLMIQIIPDRIMNNTKTIIVVTFCISILTGFLPFDRFLSLQRTFSFLPFFFLGYCLKGKNLFLPNKYKIISFLFLITMVSIPLFFHQYMGSLMHAKPYVNYYGALKRIFIFSMSIPMSLAFMNLCIKTSWIAKQGRLTMQYFIYHAIIISPLMIIIKKLGIQPSLLTAILCTFLITTGIGIILNLHFFRKLTNPSTFGKAARV